MASIEWLPEAQDDLKRLFEFIQPHSEEAAIKAVAAILGAIEKLGAFPEVGRPWEPDARFRELIVRFGARGYVTRYHYTDSRVVILRVWHSSEERSK